MRNLVVLGVSFLASLAVPLAIVLLPRPGDSVLVIGRTDEAVRAIVEAGGLLGRAAPLGIVARFDRPDFLAVLRSRGFVAVRADEHPCTAKGA